MNLLITQKEADINKKFQQKFVVGMEYGIRIAQEQNKPIRLTQAKISMFSKGFNFVVGQAKYPTFIVVQSTKFENGVLYVRGKLRDNDDPEYRLAMEIEKGKEKIKCGYNKVGDDIELQFYRFLNESKGDHYLQYEGKVRVSRGNESFYLNPTGYEANTNILEKTKKGKFLIFHIDTFGCKV